MRWLLQGKAGAAVQGERIRHILLYALRQPLLAPAQLVALQVLVAGHCGPRVLPGSAGPERAQRQGGGLFTGTHPPIRLS